MRYPVKLIGTEHYAVSAGRQNYFDGTLTTYRKRAETDAAYYSARWHLLQARALVKQTTPLNAARLGLYANTLVSTAIHKAIK